MFAGFAYAQGYFAGGQPFVLVLHPGEPTEGLFLRGVRGRQDKLPVTGRQAGLEVRGRQSRLKDVKGE